MGQRARSTPAGVDEIAEQNERIALGGTLTDRVGADGDSPLSAFRGTDRDLLDVIQAIRHTGMQRFVAAVQRTVRSNDLEIEIVD